MKLPRPAWRPAILLLTLLSGAALIGVGLWYVPMQVDGGWASYAGFAISEGREPYRHQADLSEVEEGSGVQSLFPFDTASNTRALYVAAWYWLVGPDWYAARILGVLELAVLLAVAGSFFRLVMPSAELALLATALLATDKLVLLVAATDFRPDVAQAALGCAFYLVLRRAPPNLPATLGIAVFAALSGSFSATAVTPIAIASLFRGGELLMLSGSGRIYRWAQLGVAVATSAGFYLSRHSIFPVLLGSTRSAQDPYDVPAQIAEAWGKGLPGYLEKEGARWGDYFLSSNAPLLVALALGLAAWLWPRGHDRERWALTPAVWAAVSVALFILVLLDPHPRPQHIIPAVPFLLVLLGRVDHLPSKPRRWATGALVVLVVSAGLIGLRSAWRLSADARAVGFSNTWLRDTLHELDDGAEDLWVAGGTEFWSYWDPDADVTIVDYARNPESVGQLEPALSRLHYAVLSADYMPARWMTQVERVHGIELRVLVDKRPFVVIADGFGEVRGERSVPEALP